MEALPLTRQLAKYKNKNKVLGVKLTLDFLPTTYQTIG